jgi:hypothetical protein
MADKFEDLPKEKQEEIKERLWEKIKPEVDKLREEATKKEEEKKTNG